jgi:hypothetical protein
MKVTFEATIDDYVDITVRSAPHGAKYYSDLAFASLLSGAAFSGIGYFWFRTWIAAAIAFAIGAIFLFAYNYNLRTRKIKEFYQQRKLVNGPLKVEAEISDAGLTFRQDGETVTTAWSRIEKIEETDDAIYFQRRGNLISAVRKRGFASDTEKEEFLATARRLMHEHSQADSPLPPTASE